MSFDFHERDTDVTDIEDIVNSAMMPAFMRNIEAL